MTEPKRLMNGSLSGLGKSCLQSARNDDPPLEAQDRMLLALGLSTAVATTTVTAGATVSSGLGQALRSVGVLKWFGAGALGGGLVLGAASQVHRVLPSAGSAPGTNTASATALPQPALLAPASLPSSDASDPAQELVSSAATNGSSSHGGLPSVPTPVRELVETPSSATVSLGMAVPVGESQMIIGSTPPVLAAVSSAPQPAKSALVAEVSALDRVRVAMAAGDPAGALRLLDRYQSTFPNGHLGQEAAVLRIEAWVRAGSPGVAKKLADQYLAVHPSSPLADRVRVLMGQTGNGRGRPIP